ncbi:uncharacterized protein C8Q71DRAFT_777249 [Rhodofomes roseus]|uniref:Uncharacterized protein n=1 Tax=Rhodofomes roseus TaxID=34475 RepID=A0ABQ8K678_9APHY|nr:uncharacterized protein C8Q71DRAFT_777249 [Rhodofomes roseus]KAH9832598.1 hypothetical protein C8Q71DRAFT_777249 [Rhodofomes roseus]
MSNVDDSLSSPERSPPVKVKYSARRKRRQNVANEEAEESPAEETKNEGEEEVAASPEKPASTDAEVSTKKRAPKKIDVVLRGPSPTRGRQDSPATNKRPPSRARKAPHSRAGSVASIAQEDGDTSPVKGKPLSAVGAKAFQTPARRARSPDSVADDQSVLGESSKSARARKTEAERIEFLQNDPLTEEVEAHRVFCKECQEWVDLAPKRKYVMQNWVTHRKQKHKQRGNPDKHDTSDLKSEVAADEDDGHVEDDNASVAASSVAPLETPRSEKSSRERPSNRITAMQRKLSLVNDPQVRKLTDQIVECAVCRAEVTVKGQVDYDLARWEGHKATCTKSTPRPATSSDQAGAAKVPPGAALQSPPSVASTDATAVGSDPSPSRGQKRPRDEDEEDSDQKRSVRPRSAFYEAPEGDSPGFLDWVTLPFRSFVRGFREGLSSG